MEATIKLKLKPFNVPNFVVVADHEQLHREEGMSVSRAFALSELDAVTLEKMCEEFTDAVFEKACKRRPTQAV